MNIVGLGNAGCQIASKFENLPQYSVFCIDAENKGYSTFIEVESQNSHEDYEKNYKELKLKNMAGPTTVILCGSGNISGIVLRFLEQIKNNELEQIKNNELTVFYIKPDMRTLPKEAALKHKVTFGVLQQYARSNLLKRLYVVDNQSVEEILEQVSIAEYWNDVNNIIFSTFNMLNVFENTEPLLTTFSKINKTSKIATLGVVSFDGFKERLFYGLQKPRIKRYFFGVNKETLDKEKDLLSRIRNFTHEGSDENVSANFAIYSTDYEHNYIYTAHYASMIQEENIS